MCFALYDGAWILKDNYERGRLVTSKRAILPASFVITLITIFIASLICGVLKLPFVFTFAVLSNRIGELYCGLIGLVIAVPSCVLLIQLPGWIIASKKKKQLAQLDNQPLLTQ
jgi:hypothetical protein